MAPQRLRKLREEVLETPYGVEHAGMVSLERMLLLSLREHWLEIEKEEEEEEEKIILLEDLHAVFCCPEAVVWMSDTSTHSFSV